MIDASLLTCDPALMPNDPSVVNIITTKLGVYYTFQKAGLSIPTHVHTDNNIHATIVLAGSISVIRASDAPVIYNQGDVADFLSGVSHSITATVPGTIIYNIVKFGVSKESMATDLNDVSADLDKISQTIANMKAIINA